MTSCATPIGSKFMYIYCKEWLGQETVHNKTRHHVKLQQCILIVVCKLQQAEVHKTRAYRKCTHCSLWIREENTESEAYTYIFRLFCTPPTVPCTFNIESPYYVDFLGNEKAYGSNVSIVGGSFHYSRIGRINCEDVKKCVHCWGVLFPGASTRQGSTVQLQPIDRVHMNTDTLTATCVHGAALYNCNSLAWCTWTLCMHWHIPNIILCISSLHSCTPQPDQWRLLFKRGRAGEYTSCACTHMSVLNNLTVT